LHWQYTNNCLYQSLLLNRDSANWKVIPHFYFDQYGRDFLVFYMDIDVFKNLPKLKLKIPKFYDDLINIWIGFRNITHVNNTSNRLYHIRQQLLWGNRFMKDKHGKCLVFKHWICSNIIFVDDILLLSDLSDDGSISEDVVLSRLHNQTNWIAEFCLIKKCIRAEWKQRVKHYDSLTTKVKTSLVILMSGTQRFHELNNKDFYNIFKKQVLEMPYIHAF